MAVDAQTKSAMRIDRYGELVFFTDEIGHSQHCKVSLEFRSKRRGIMRTSDGGKYLTWVLVGVYLVLTVNAAHPQDRLATSQGTVNIGLGNANGVVLLTDSMQSFKQGNEWHRIQPAQKLFRLDDKTVCSIAGFASEKGWISQELNTDVSGIIADVKDELARKPVEELDAKLAAVAFLVGFYIDVVANRREVLEPNVPVNPSTYKFEVIVAGYAKDGALKIKKLILTSRVSQPADGTKYWTHTTSAEEPTTEKGLTHLFGGIQDVSQKIVDSPNEFRTSVAVQKYARFKSTKNAKPLSLAELAALASEMAAQTSKDPHFNGFVGGRDQVAILADGKILKLDQPTFPDPPRPLKFVFMVDLEVRGALNLVTSPNTHFLWIRSDFVRIRNPALRLDGQFFYGCEIRDSLVEYGGGLTDFGLTNKVIDSMLLPGFGGPGSSTENFLRVGNGFHWRSTPPDAPPTPPIIGPRQPH